MVSHEEPDRVRVAGVIDEAEAGGQTPTDLLPVKELTADLDLEILHKRLDEN